MKFLFQLFWIALFPHPELDFRDDVNLKSNDTFIFQEKKRTYRVSKILESAITETNEEFFWDLITVFHLIINMHTIWQINKLFLGK